MHPLFATRRLRENEKYTVAEAIEIGKAEGITLQNFDFVVAAFCKSV